jgi:molybdate/tungstate transport system substrate-binding protein
MLRPLLPALCLLAAACSTAADDRVTNGTHRDTVVVFAAASLAGPMRAALDTFARRTGAVVAEEHGASLELARRITELKRVPDVIALADQEVFAGVLTPAYTTWHTRFARNRMVIAYTDNSRAAAEMDVNRWWTVLLRPDVRVGRSDPELAPAGYRALLTYQLAESYYQRPGLAARLAARTPPALMRGNAAELAALLEAGELDYIVDYESLAHSHGFRFVALPGAIDLGDARQASTYARATVRVKRGADSVTITGAPILYGVSVPTRAPHHDAGARFLAFLLGTEGRALLRRGNVDALEIPEAVGTGVPAIVTATLRQ